MILFNPVVAVDKSLPQPPFEEIPSSTFIWLIRHAEVEASYQRVFGGRIDMNLSPRGQLQAAALAGYLKNRRFDAVYASPMRRVQQTLEPLRNGNWPAPTIMADLREVDFGAWTGLSWDDVQAKFGISAFAWLHQLECGAIPQAECAATLRSRIEPCLKQILHDHRGQTVAIACHGGVIRMALSILLGFPLSSMSAVEVEYASITQVAWLPGRARVELLNFTPWRDLP